MQTTELTGKEENIKLPLYVTAYETIFGWLKSGKYRPGDKLPGENILSEQLGVSRGTLRQAMLLLQEDGLIINHQGKGSFVLSGMDITQTGIEKLNNPLVGFSADPIEQIQTSIHFQMATEKHRELLHLAPSKLVAFIEILYRSRKQVVGFAMVFMPYDILSKNEVNLEDSDAVFRFYNSYLESGGLSTESKIRIVYARQATAQKMGIEENAPLLMMEETIRSDFDEPVLSQKLFFLPDSYELMVRRKNDRSMTKLI